MGLPWHSGPGRALARHVGNLGNTNVPMKGIEKKRSDLGKLFQVGVKRGEKEWTWRDKKNQEIVLPESRHAQNSKKCDSTCIKLCRRSRK